MESLGVTYDTGNPAGSVPAVTKDRPRIILAEDDTETRCLLAAQLRRRGYYVTTARDGVELLDELEAVVSRRKAPFDAIIGDVYMPNLGGLDVLAALGCAHWQTPFIVITARATSDTRVEGKVLGAAAVLAKPFAMTELESALDAAIASSTGDAARQGGEA